MAGSPDVEIYGNILTGNTNGIMLVQQRRSDSPSPHGPHELDNISVHDNDVSMTQNVTGMVNDTEDDGFYSRNIRFDNNTYRLARLDGEFFAWAGDNVTRTTWTQRIGHDRTGKFLTS